MISLPKTISKQVLAAAVKAMPELQERIAVTPEKGKEWEYVTPSLITIFNKYRKQGSFGFATCQEMALAVQSSLHTEQSTMIEKVELSQAGKGDPTKSGFFLNIFLKNEFIEQQVMQILLKNAVSVEPSENFAPRKVLVDFSSPNIAKDMHVGHLRSTIQGDCICRIFEFLGWEVLRTNHVGDWGTQFGMLIAELFDKYPDLFQSPPDIQDLEIFYKQSKVRFDQEPDFKEKAYANVVKLQQGDEQIYKAWQILCEISRKQFQVIYDRLSVVLDEVGESFYNPLLKPLIEELVANGKAVKDQGATCIFIPKQKVPLMIQKTDGGYNYDTTDLAAIRYRIEEKKVDQIVYITDIGQEFHFKLVFEGAKVCGFYDPAKTKVDHMGFGLILQKVEEEKKEEEKEEQKQANNKQSEPEQKPLQEGQVPAQEEKKEAPKQQEPQKAKEEEKKGKKEKPKKDKPKVTKMKTREGKSVKLISLMDEAQSRAAALFRQKLNQEGKGKVTEDEIEESAEILGISSIKYYDLRQNRIQDYIFDFDKMLDPKGNTGVYLIYMYVRICSILRKGNYTPEKLQELKQTAQFKISHPSEKELALALLKLPEQIELALNDLQMNRVTDLIYEVSVKIAEFYQQCHTLGSEQEQSRILLLEATRMVMKALFDMIGMKTLEKI